MLSRDSRGGVRAGAAVSVALGLAMAGCNADYVEQNQSSVLLLVESINGGAPVLSDVRGENGAIVNCQTELEVAARAKNPLNPGTAAEDVRLSSYEITYRRSDGRGTEGLDVPFRIAGPTTATLVAGGDPSTLVLDLVRHQAKLEPPLINIVGLQVVTMFADVTVYGETISRKAVTATGTVQVTFADYADGTTTCESQ